MKKYGGLSIEIVLLSFTSKINYRIYSAFVNLMTQTFGRLDNNNYFCKQYCFGQPTIKGHTKVKNKISKINKPIAKQSNYSQEL